MKAYAVREAGEPDALRLEKVPEPVTGHGEVRIADEAIEVNRLDLDVRSGMGARSTSLQLGTEALGEMIAGASTFRVL